MAINKELIKDDLYEAVNGAWIKDAKIPDDKPATGGFNDLVDKIDKQMMADFEDYADGKKTSDDPHYTGWRRSLTCGKRSALCRYNACWLASQLLIHTLTTRSSGRTGC